MRILIATDGLPHSDLAVQMGAQLFWFTGCTPTVLTVVRRQSEQLHAEGVLAAAREKLETAVPTVHTTIRVGHPVTEIVREAGAGQYDLLVVGQHPEYGVLTRLTGTTVARILHDAPCPVLVAKGVIDSLLRLLLCESGGRYPSLLSRLMTTFSSLLHDETTISVLHVMSQISVGPDSPDWQLRADANMLIEAQTYEGNLLRRGVQVLQRTPAQQAPLVRHGLIVDEVVAEAARGHYGLVVIGSHPADYWSRLLLDDLAYQIVARLDCPILVMR